MRTGEQPGSLCVQHLPCFCDNCLDGEHQRSSNKDYVNSWTAVDAQLETLPERCITRSETTDDHEDWKSLVFKSSTIAIAAADRREDYYLLKVTGEGEEVLQQSEKDGYNLSTAGAVTYSEGTSIIPFVKTLFILLWIPQNKPMHFQKLCATFALHFKSSIMRKKT